MYTCYTQGGIPTVVYTCYTHREAYPPRYTPSNTHREAYPPWYTLLRSEAYPPWYTLKYKSGIPTMVHPEVYTLRYTLVGSLPLSSLRCTPWYMPPYCVVHRLYYTLEVPRGQRGLPRALSPAARFTVINVRKVPPQALPVCLMSERCSLGLPGVVKEAKTSSLDPPWGG